MLAEVFIKNCIFLSEMAGGKRSAGDRTYIIYDLSDYENSISYFKECGINTKSSSFSRYTFLGYFFVEMVIF